MKTYPCNLFIFFSFKSKKSKQNNGESKDVLVSMMTTSFV